MKSLKKIVIAAAILICNMVFLHTVFSQSKTNEQESGSEKKYDVAAIVWPSYHPDDRAKIFWPDGIGEWQTVKSNQPKFEGHEQPRYPIWGFDRYR